MKRLHNASLHNHVYSQGKMFKFFCIQKYHFSTSAIICNKERKYLLKTGYQLQNGGKVFLRGGREIGACVISSSICTS